MPPPRCSPAWTAPPSWLGPPGPAPAATRAPYSPRLWPATTAGSSPPSARQARQVATPAVRNLIRENNLQQLRSSIETGAKEGMHSLNSSLLDLVHNGNITAEMAMMNSNDVKGMMRELSRFDARGAVGRA